MSDCNVCGKPYVEHGGMNATCPIKPRERADRALIINAVTNQCAHVGDYMVTIDGEDVCAACAVIIEPILAAVSGWGEAKPIPKLCADLHIWADAADEGDRISYAYANGAACPDVVSQMGADIRQAASEIMRLRSFIADEIAKEHRALDEWREHGGPDWKPDHPAMLRLKRFSDALRQLTTAHTA